MKTSKEMQLKIIDKMRENVEGGKPLFKGVYRKPIDEKYILNGLWENSFIDVEHGVYPQTITINGVEIPKPLMDSEILEDEVYYHVDNSEFLYEAKHGEFIADYGIRFVYTTKEEAIEASKALFGIEC